MRMEQGSVEVTDEEVDEALHKLQEEQAVWNPVERPAQLGDLMTMAVTERVGDEVLSENDNVEHELNLVETADEEEDGEARPDLTTPLIGLSAGDEKEFTVHFSESVSDPRYAGQDVTFAVRVHGVKEKEVYPLDDEFAQMVGDFDTLDELRAQVAEDIRQNKQRQADQELGEKALEQVIEDAQRIEWPKVLEEEEIDNALKDQDRRLQQRGLSLETYLSMQKTTPEQLREEFRPAIQQRLRRSLVLAELAKQENLNVGGHEVVGQIDRLSTLAGERGDELREALSRPSNLQHLIGDMMTSKVTGRLVQIVKGEAAGEAEAETAAEAETETEVGTPEQVDTETPASI
jgi:trigger factor